MKRMAFNLLVLIVLVSIGASLNIAGAEFWDSKNFCKPLMPSKVESTIYQDIKHKKIKSIESEKRRGCCSWHGGVCGCDSISGRVICCDGTLSPSCT